MAPYTLSALLLALHVLGLVKTASVLLNVADEPLDWLASHYYKLYAPISSSDKLVGFDPCQILSQIKANSDSFGRLWVSTFFCSDKNRYHRVG